METVSFTRMLDGTREDFELLERKGQAYVAGLPDRLLAVFALVLKLVVLALLLRPAFVGPVFLVLVRAFAFFAVGLVLIALFRVLTDLLAERR